MFLRRSSKKEFNAFCDEINHIYKPLGINFSYHNWKISHDNPEETPDHYSIFSYWVAEKLASKKKLKILDIGNTKYANMFNSLLHDVVALVLKKPRVELSKVFWLEHDISEPLPFEDNYFDVITSPSTLHLIGLGRYGDEKNPAALMNFLKEAARVTRLNSKMYLMLPLGRDQLLYGFHFIYSFETIGKIFNNWKIIDYMVDDYIKFGSIKYLNRKFSRFDSDTNIDNFKIGDYKIIYLELEKIV